MEEVLSDINNFVNQCLGFLGAQPASGEVSDFMSNVITILMQLAATGLMFLVVKHFLWNKVTKLIEGRQELINNELKEAQEAKSKALELALSTDKEFQAAKDEAKKMITDAVKEGNLQRDKIISDAKDEAKRRLNNADEEMKLEIEKSKKEIKDAIVDVAFAAAEKIVKAEIDRRKHQDIVKEFIEEVGK